MPKKRRIHFHFLQRFLVLPVTVPKSVNYEERKSKWCISQPCGHLLVAYLGQSSGPTTEVWCHVSDRKGCRRPWCTLLPQAPSLRCCHRSCTTVRPLSSCSTLKNTTKNIYIYYIAHYGVCTFSSHSTSPSNDWRQCCKILHAKKTKQLWSAVLYFSRKLLVLRPSIIKNLVCQSAFISILAKTLPRGKCDSYFICSNCNLFFQALTQKMTRQSHAHAVWWLKSITLIKHELLQLLR